MRQKMRIYYMTAVLGVVFAVLGFGYNTWRMEVTEANNNVRTAAFEMLTNLAELEQIIYAAHYDQDSVAGSARKGWVKVGLINDLAMLTSDSVSQSASALQTRWAKHWEHIGSDRDKVDALVADIDSVRAALKTTLRSLK